MPQLKRQRTRTLSIKPNNRSSDFVTPNFIYGCLGGCRNSYCYVMRYNYDHVYINENTEALLAVLRRHADALDWPKRANQVDPVYWTYDIGCSTDVALHWKHYDWPRVFDFFRDHPKAKATFATKYVNDQLLAYSPAGKVRIRFSLMPQRISSILEPRTTAIAERIAAVERFVEAGYEVHLNFSPIVVYQGWLDDYQALFEALDRVLPDRLKPAVHAECIFVTHNPWQHQRNLDHGHRASERLLWVPDLQEAKTAQYGSQAVRYRRDYKAQFVQQWRALHEQHLAWNRIRYIF